MTQTNLRILGGFLLVGKDGQEVPIPGKKVQALLAYLAMNPGQKHSREKLATLLWGDRMDEQARHSLRQALLALRKALGTAVGGEKTDPLSTDNETAALNAGALDTDVEGFRTHAADGTPHDLEAAVALYAGPLLEGLRADAEEFDLWLVRERERLHTPACGVLERLAEHQENAGDTDNAIETAKRLISIDPAREKGHRLLMRMYLATGRRADALRQYQACVEVLRRELDAEPSAETVQLYDALREGTTQTEPKQTPMQPAPLPPAVEPQGPMVTEGGERRIATLTLHKLHGLSALNRRMDPEEVERIVNAFTAEAGRMVKEHGGTINPLQRDEMEVLFGIPTAHEDDPVRAVQAALALHSLAKRTLQKAGRKGTEGLRLSTGISTGLTVARAPSSIEGAFKLTGEAMDTAAKLMALAKPGRILVGGETGRLIEPFFDLSAFPPSREKKEPVVVQAYQVEGETPLRTRFQAAEQRGLARFAGRENEMSALREALEQALARRGQFITVVGEAGIGKTRLMHEFRKQLDDKALTLLEGRAHAQGGNTPYLPFLEGLRRLFHLEGASTGDSAIETMEGAIQEIDPLLGSYLPFFLHLLSIPSDTHPLPPNLHGEELRRKIQLALVGLFTRSAERRPIVLLLDDWHWVDEVSQAALDYLVGMIASLPILIVVCYREGHNPAWTSPERHSQLYLRSFEMAHSETLIQAVLGAGRLPDGLSEAIHDRTEGNPFFIEEICRALLEAETVQVRGKTAVLDSPLDTLRLPDSVQAVIRTRLDGLAGPVRGLLQQAAVIGREFSAGLLERISPGGESIHSELAVLKAADLIQQVRVIPEEVYVFKHSITQEVAYEGLLLKQRRETHLRVAEAIENLYRERLPDYHESLAFHFRQAEDWRRAAQYSFSAADSAKAHYAYANAIELCTHGLAAAEKAEEGAGASRERVRGLVLLADLQSLLGEFETANQSYEKALVINQEAGDDPALNTSIKNKMHLPHSVVRDGGRIVYYEHGSGKTTLVLIRPLTYGAMYQPVVERLCETFRIISIEPRGVGGSDPFTRPYPLSQHSEDVRAVIEASNTNPVVGVGNSSGGAVLVHLAALHPHLFESIVLVDPAMPVPGKKGILQNPNTNPKIDEALAAKDLKRAVSKFIPIVVSEPGTEALAKHAVKTMMNLPPETIYSFFLDRDEDEKVHELLGGISMPALVMHGTEDRRVPLEIGKYIAEQIDGGLFYPLEGKGHLPMATATGEFCEVLRQFILTGTVSKEP